MSGDIVVFAYSEVGHACLKLLLDRGERVAALFTHEDDASERQWFSSCARLAREHGVPVYTVEPRQGDEVERVVAEIAPDLILSFYYRKLIPERILSLARLGAFNMHGSLLPRYRGRAPLNWAIIHGESETGVTLHVMVKAADAGDMIDWQAVPIGPDETAGEVAKRIPAAAAAVISRQIDALKAGRAPRHKQDENRVTYYGIRRPEDGLIDWHQTPRQVIDLVRAVTLPFPGAFTFADGRKIMVWRAAQASGRGAPGEILSCEPLTVATGEGAVALLQFGFEGKSEADASRDVLAMLKPGIILGAAG